MWSEPSLEYLQLYVPVSLALSCVTVSLLQCEWGWCLESHGSTFTPSDEIDRWGSPSVQCSWPWPLTEDREQPFKINPQTDIAKSLYCWSILWKQSTGSWQWPLNLFSLAWQRLLLWLFWRDVHFKFILSYSWVIQQFELSHGNMFLLNDVLS